MTQTVTKNYIPITSDSLTSIKLTQHSKVYSIISKLQARRNELLEIIKQKEMFANLQNPSVTLKKSQQSYKTIKASHNTIAQTEDIGKMRQRKHKYQNKIEKQTQQYQLLHKQSKQTNQKVMQCVIQLQQNQMQLKNISESVGAIYRQHLGIKKEGQQSCRKWIYFRILQLETQLQSSQMNMRGVICKFFAQLNNLKDQPDKDIVIPDCWLVQHIVKSKLVNKLYGLILQNKEYRNREEQTINLQHQSQQQQQKYEGQYSDSDNQQSFEAKKPKIDSKKCHQIWLQILKLMKMLQKMEAPQTKKQQPGPFSESTLDIQQFKTLIHEKISLSKKIKAQSQHLACTIKQLKTKLQQLNQQQRIKQQLVASFKQKCMKLQKQMAAQTKNQLQIRDTEENNSKKMFQQINKQLKEIQEALKYFNIKKNTFLQNNQRNIQSTSNLKLMEQRTQFKSPQKQKLNSVNQQRYLSPNCCGTKLKSNKYSLTYLLSPQKQIVSQSKRKAWK